MFPVLYHTLPQAVSVCQRGQAARGEDGGGEGEEGERREGKGVLDLKARR